MPGTTMREVLLHGGMDEAFDRSVVFARQLAESFGARLHVIYTLEDPLAAGWTAEVSADRLPEVHQAIEDEARERLSRRISRGRGGRPLHQRTPHRPRHRPGPCRARVDARTRAHRAGSMRGARAAVIPSDLLLAAYSSGWFPMADESGTISWYSPDPRGVIEFDTVGVGRANFIGFRRGGRICTHRCHRLRRKH